MEYQESDAQESPQAAADAILTHLLNLHTSKRRLVLMIERRQRAGQPTDALEAQLAAQRQKASALMQSLQT